MKNTKEFDFSKTALNGHYPNLEHPSQEKLVSLGLFDNTAKPYPIYKPFFCNTCRVWAAAIDENTPVYALYTMGTNRLVILKRENKGDWKIINVEEIENIYGLLWMIGIFAPADLADVHNKIKEITASL